MTRRSSVAIALGACLVATLFLMPVSAVQDKDAKGSAAKESRIDGTIQSLDKGTKTIVVRLRGKGDTKQVVYDLAPSSPSGTRPQRSTTSKTDGASSAWAPTTTRTS